MNIISFFHLKKKSVEKDDSHEIIGGAHDTSFLQNLSSHQRQNLKRVVFEGMVWVLSVSCLDIL